jgi:uncharacterized membrane protein
VVIVVMASDLRDAVPHDPADLAAWAPAAPRLLAFVLGFFTLAVVWVNHSVLTGALERATRGTLWLNLNVLFWISLFPVTVRMLGGAQPMEIGAVAYGAVLTAMALRSVWKSAAHARRVKVIWSAVALIPLLGPVAWYLLGRTRRKR